MSLNTTMSLFALFVLAVILFLEVRKFSLNRPVPSQPPVHNDDALIAESVKFLGEWAEADKERATLTESVEPDGDIPVKSQMAQRTAEFRARIQAEAKARMNHGD